MYKVINYFTDLEDKNTPYEVGDTYPREDYEPTQKRIEELLSNDNGQGRPVIEGAEEEKSFEKMSLEELKKYAEEKGIGLDGATKKAGIIEVIKAAEAKTDEPEKE